MTDEFAEAVAECISKGVLHYTVMPQGGGLPDGKQKETEGPDDT
jgi:hypothetical protein